MTPKTIFKAIALSVALTLSVHAEQADVKEVAPGIWRVRFGEAEQFTPVSEFSGTVDAAALENVGSVERPFDLNGIRCELMRRGAKLAIPMMRPDEEFYGMGLQLQTFQHRGHRRIVRSSDSQSYLGYSHAPAPFYVSTAGYGVLVDTSRYAEFYFGSLNESQDIDETKASTFGQSLDDAIALAVDQHAAKGEAGGFRVHVDVPSVAGVDVYVFAGPTIRQAVQRYNLFSGGGAMPPMWGLGVEYRGLQGADAAWSLKRAQEIRDEQMPCTIYGLEPSWNSHYYPCSYDWSEERWSNPESFIKSIHGMGYKVSLWEQAFVSPKASIYQDLKPYSGDFSIWGGIVPDFAHPKAKEIFFGQHDRDLIAKGVDAFKVDAPEDQPLSTVQRWGFPPFSSFPSGIDGEEMHSLWIVMWQREMQKIFETHNRRTWGAARNSHALASSYPFILFSDHYDEHEFVRGIPSAGFAGLLWQPDFRFTKTKEEFYRRLQFSIFSPAVVINAWYAQLPYWQQFEKEKNDRLDVLPVPVKAEIAEVTRRLLNFRMRLIPYLYSAFYRYHAEGIAPFRALVQDWQGDKNVYGIDTQYLMGESMMVIPFFTSDGTARDAYVPEGVWFDLITHERYEGGKTHTFRKQPQEFCVLVKNNSIIPLGQEMQTLDGDTVFELNCLVFGDNPEPFVLIEDDGETFDFKHGAFNTVTLSWENGEGRIDRRGSFKKIRYNVVNWEKVIEPKSV